MKILSNMSLRLKEMSKKTLAIILAAALVLTVVLPVTVTALLKNEQVKNGDEAEQMTESSLSENDKFTKETSEEITQNVDSAEVLKSSCLDKINNQDYNGALADINSAIELSKSDASLYLLQGAANTYLNEYDKAIESYKTAFGLNPEYTQVHQAMAYLYYQIGQKDTALAEYTTALTYDFDNTELLQMRMSIYAEQKNYTNALVDARHLSSLKPEDANTYACVGDYQFNLQKFSDSAESYTKSLKYALIENNNTLINAVTLQRAMCYYNIQDYSSAITDYTSYFSLSTTASTDWIYLAQSYYNISDMANAKIWFEKCLDANIQAVVCKYNLAAIYSTEENHTTAVEYYTACIDANYLKDYSLYNRGVSYLSLKEYQKARADFLSASETTTNEKLKAQATSSYNKTPNITIITGSPSSN